MAPANEEILLTDEDIAFIIDTLQYALRSSKAGFARRMLSRENMDHDHVQDKIDKFNSYKSRAEAIIAKLQGKGVKDAG